ncbi:hypothetical protein [Novosphingobium subterraneum]|uniref:Uncharacterized protein n=1 Tax=Novosphingobium subterraneum TaxID=48936 RepID=A0A0B8ZK10_9SPHN|nr:hypothetical protein [Novosphingobium subterraneum]KHS43405.1 hypothetical protein NJ75_03714 [Novosphingobium subterraneum]
MAVLQHRADFARETERPFSPRSFIALFTACGGGYCLTPGGQLWLGVLQTGSERADRTMAAQIMRVLTPENIESIREYLLSGDSAGPLQGAWNEGKARYDRAVQEFDAKAAEDPACDALDQLCDVLTDTEDSLFRMNAPSMQAVLWKLDRLQEEADGSSINPGQIKQVSDDIRRLFGEA